MFNFNSIINVLNKVDSAIDTGVNKYTSACDTAERKVMNKLTKKDIMIDDALDAGAEKTKTLVVETIVPFVKTSSTTVKDTVVSKATELKDKISTKITPTTTPSTQEEKEVELPFEQATTQVEAAPFAAVINTQHIIPQMDLSINMPAALPVPTLYRMHAFVSNMKEHTPVAKCA